MTLEGSRGAGHMAQGAAAPCHPAGAAHALSVRPSLRWSLATFRSRYLATATAPTWKKMRHAACQPTNLIQLLQLLYAFRALAASAQQRSNVSTLKKTISSCQHKKSCRRSDVCDSAQFRSYLHWRDYLQRDVRWDGLGLWVYLDLNRL